MKTKEEFFELLKTIELPRQKTFEWYKETFDFSEYTYEVYKYSNSYIDLEYIIEHQVSKSIYVDEMRQYFNNFFDGIKKHSKIALNIGYDNCSSAMNAEFVISKPDGTVPENDMIVHERLKKWVKEYQDNQKEYEKYLELKQKYE